jgi:plasmid stabilization system protein ParE
LQFSSIAEQLGDLLSRQGLTLQLPDLGSPARHPSAHCPGGGDLRPGLRSFPVDTYIILYRIEGEEVLILHVLDGRRDIAALV